MALINCYECEKPVSSSAATCPFCGVPLKTAFNNVIAVMVLAVVVGFIGFMGYVLWIFFRPGKLLTF